MLKDHEKLMYEALEKAIYESLTGKYKHYCPDWDFMPIDETRPEFDQCTCDFSRLPPERPLENPDEDK